MEPVFRGITIYLFLWLIFRVSGKRTLAQTSPFELVLLLIISEVTNQAMVDSDHSITNAILLIITLVGMSILLSVIKHYSPAASRWLEGLPLPLVRDGELLRENLDKTRVDEAEIMKSARCTQGVDRMDDVRDATIENDGTISIVPREP
ncbi:DUF421 domain-containing protein [Luteimonas granuli]|uniref:DUF421 domain-containing protein n=1 Tax=Luteimonas granuli TaxID=1176533 RepID=A0A518N4P8_9GAMM|nr:YetF domain-containing protein [Luteimonas granuli]QDW66878.1 DUF421 domain-containing protein [Luteimonas granuli]